jgi:RNA polymerase sigma-70 factor (ECF subfamily)
MDVERMACDRETFGELVDQHGASVLALLHRLCGGGHDAEDLFQDVALRVWRNLNSRPRLRNPRGWLMTIAYHAYLDYRARNPTVRLLPEDDSVPSVRRDQDPVAVAEHRERCLVLERAVAGLSPALREVVILHYTGGLSLRQVARTLGLSVGTVKSRLSAGLEQLRRQMS